MSSNPPTENSAKDSSQQAAVSADELLPPIEPPNAGFIIQLFVVPALIVLGVVLLWLLVTTLATQGDQDPGKIVAALRGSNQARWQKAEELASMLRLEKRYPELKHNSELAGQLAALLDEEIEKRLDDKNSISLRYYLCRVLGEFYVDEGLEVLLKAARDDAERDVRREAINALAVLSDSLRKQDPEISLEHPKFVDTCVGLANDEDDLIRSQTAFALGVFVAADDSDPQLMAELELLADDLYSDARYNAALGLSRSGNLKAVHAVSEMFDPEALEKNVNSEKTAALQTFKRNTILSNALEAARLLIEKNPSADLTTLRESIQQFVSTGTAWQPEAVPDSLIERGKQLLADSSS